MGPTSSPWLADAVRGGIAGYVGTWLMDQATTGLLTAQSGESRRREEAARPHGRSSVENLVERIAARLDLGLDEPQRAMAAHVVHFGLGVVPGAMYAVLRRRVRWLGTGRGLVFGALLWALNDEYLNTRLGLAGPYGAYPVETHWRGLVGHLVLGAAIDTTIDVLGGRAE